MEGSPRCPLFLSGSLPRPTGSRSSAPSCCRLGGLARGPEVQAGRGRKAWSQGCWHFDTSCFSSSSEPRAWASGPFPVIDGLRAPAPGAPTDSAVGQCPHPSPVGLLVTVGQFSWGGCACTSRDSVGFWSLRCPPAVRGSGPAVGTQARTGPHASLAGRPCVLPHLRGQASSGWVAALSSHHHLARTPSGPGAG